MVASDVMLKVVLKYQQVKHCEVRLDGGERIDRVETSVRLPELENEKSILQICAIYFIKKF